MLERLLYQKSLADFFPKSKHSFLLPPKRFPREKKNLSNVQYIRVVKMQAALSTWVKFMLPRTGFSVFCRALANRLCYGQAKTAFQKEEEDFVNTTFSVLAPDADVEVSPVLLQLWVAVVGTGLRSVAQRA